MAGTLFITDGTTRVNLKDGPLYLSDWTPALANPKAGGIFSDSPLSDGRRLVHRRTENTIDTFDIKVSTWDMDGTIYATQELRRLLEKACSYWTSQWQNSPVWLEARGTCETNTRYSLIYDYRTPNDDNPYMQPFAKARKAAIDNFSVVIEHGPWLALPPTTGECTTIKATQSWSYPYYLAFGGAASPGDRVNCGSDATLDNLPTGANGFTAEVWAKISALDVGTIRYMFTKTGGGVGWRFGFGGAAGLAIYGQIISGGVSALINITTLNLTIPLNTWFHIAFTYEDTVNRKIRIFFNGIEPIYNIQTAMVGVCGNDAGNDLVLGNYAAVLANALNGNMGWTRISNTRRYLANFTPPPRCTMPTIDANTVGQWIQEGTGATTYDQAGLAARNGAITGATWGVDCTQTVGQETVCTQAELPLTLETAYIANHKAETVFTHIFAFDASTGLYSANRVAAALPWTIFDQPTALAIGDIVYFGSGLAIPTGIPLSLVLNIGTVAVNFEITWEYYNGGWVALVVDNLDIAGIHIIQAKVQDSTVLNVNGIVAFWIRGRITNVMGATVAPIQITRRAYSVNYPYTEISSIDGDIAASSKLILFDTLSQPEENVPRYIMGLRSLTRGSNFSAYINMSLAYNPPGLLVSSTAISAIVLSSISPTYNCIQVLYAGGPPLPFTSAVRLVWSSNSAEYIGKYRLFIRVTQALGSSGDWSLRWLYRKFEAGATYIPVYTISKPVVTSGAPAVAKPTLVDLGIIEILPGMTIDTNLSFDIQVQNLSGVASTLYILDAILMPVDEYSMDTNLAISFTGLGGGSLLETDGLTEKTGVICNAYGGADSRGIFYPVISEAIKLPTNTNSRLWFLQSTETAGTLSRVFDIRGVLISKNERYLSMRGNR